MRQVINPQLQFGQIDISTIKFDPKSRDDIPKILRGLQHIYVTTKLREAIFSLLEKEILPKVNKHTGRPGMELWKILVTGVLRLDLNCDFDHLHELVNHQTDTNLLLDAMRKTLYLGASLCNKDELSDLRQYQYNYRKLKWMQRQTQKAKRSNVQTKVQSTHKEYIQQCARELAKVEKIVNKIELLTALSITDKLLIDEITGYTKHAKYQIDQVERRVINGEVIPHAEKVFSLFEPHTEWICKGKAGIPVES